MLLEDWIRLQPGDRDDLLRDARRVAAQLPPATGPGRTVALAFGRDLRAFRASVVACWLRGYGAAVVGGGAVVGGAAVVGGTVVVAGGTVVVGAGCVVEDTSGTVVLDGSTVVVGSPTPRRTWLGNIE